MLQELKKYLSISVMTLGMLVVQTASAVTIVLDFNEAFQSNTQTTVFDATTNAESEVRTFDVAAFGSFGTADDFDFVTQRILQEINTDYHGIATGGASPIGIGQELDIDFVIGDIGFAPSNGDSEYFYIQIGTEAGSGGPLGFACIACVRGGVGTVPVSSVVGTIFSDNIQGLTGVGAALSSGNIDATAYALAGTISHEIGHTLSLGHIYRDTAVTPNGLDPLMGTGALDLPNAARIVDREFSLSGEDSDGSGGRTPVNYIQDLVNVLGLRDAPSTSVPLPASWVLLLLGAIIMMRKTRRL